MREDKTTLYPNQADAGVMIDGIRWATRNVDAPGTFADTSECAGMFFQWNRRVGWSSTDPMINSDDGAVWNHREVDGTAWYSENDPCPSGWRVPTIWELRTLGNADCTFKTTDNGVSGRLFGTSPNQIFFAGCELPEY